jgi:hypothetical protein
MKKWVINNSKSAHRPLHLPQQAEGGTRGLTLLRQAFMAANPPQFLKAIGLLTLPHSGGDVPYSR